jgi:hypothetical protein
MQTIYLVGQISPKDPESYMWRSDVKEHFKENDQIYIIDPCSNPFNQKTLAKQKYAVTKEKRSFGIDLLVPKDRSFVARSDIGLVNMNHFDPEKCLLGSFFELAWYYDSPEKAVIAWADDLNSYQCQHPFVQMSVTTWCRDVAEACYLVEKYFISV